MYKLGDVVVYDGSNYKICGVNIDKQGRFYYSITPTDDHCFEIIINKIYDDEIEQW